MITINLKKRKIDFDSHKYTQDWLDSFVINNAVNDIITAQFRFVMHSLDDIKALHADLGKDGYVCIETFDDKQIKMHVVDTNYSLDPVRDVDDDETDRPYIYEISADFYPQHLMKYKRIYSKSSLYYAVYPNPDKEDIENAQCIKSDIAGVDEKEMRPLITDPESFDVSELDKTEYAKKVLNEMIDPRKYMLEGISYLKFLLSQEVLNNRVNFIAFSMDDNNEKTKIGLYSLQDMSEQPIIDKEIQLKDEDMTEIWLDYNIIDNTDGRFFTGYLKTAMSFSDGENEGEILVKSSDGLLYDMDEISKNNFMFFVNNLGKGVRLNVASLSSDEKKEYKFIMTSFSYSYKYHPITRDSDTSFILGLSSVVSLYEKEGSEGSEGEKSEG